MEKAVVLDGVDLMGLSSLGCIDLVSAGTGQMDKRLWLPSMLTKTIKEKER